MKNGKYDIHKKHGIGKVQSILVSKNLYPTEEKAREYVKRQGYDDSYKLHPDSTLHFWRFRQHKPLPGSEYITKSIGETDNKAVIELGDGDWKDKTKSDKKLLKGHLGAGKSYMKFGKGGNENYADLLKRHEGMPEHAGYKQTAGEQDVDQELKRIHEKGARWLAKAPNLHTEMDWDEAHALKNLYEAEAERKKLWDERAHKKIAHRIRQKHHN